MKIIKFIILFNTTFVVPSYTQDIKPAIKILGKAGYQAIKLRWAPTTASSWKRLNEYGYTIERVTISRKNKLLPVPEKTIITPLPIKPSPLSDWELIVDQNDYAAIAAQSLYGETFELTENYSSDIVQIINKSKELDQRFSFALFAADQSFSVAELSGLAFVDHSAVKTEKYLYRVISAVPQEIESIEKGFVYIGLSDYEELPTIYDLQANFGNKAVVLSWERENFDGIYNSFIVEKSTDGGNTYLPITNLPIVNTTKDEKNDSRRAFKIDSLEENGKEYYYRVKGINAFGEVSPPSDSIFGSGFIPISSTPNLIDWQTNNTTVDLTWEFKGVAPIDGFRIDRSPKEAGPFQTIKELGSKERKYNDPTPLPTNYYRITAFNNNSKSSSFPVLVQLEDSIPPLSPVGLVGIIDTLGIVQLQWVANNEPDLFGYRIYRSNFKNAEFGQVTNEAITHNTWQDSLSINTLTSSVYYKVTAVDIRFNESLVSETLKLKKPDIIPPVPPVFSTISSVTNGIKLAYKNSSSTDVEKYHIYRKPFKEVSWLKIAEKSSTGSSKWVDSTAQVNTLYQYTMLAIDSSGNESKPASLVSSSFIRTITKEAPHHLQARVDRAEKNITLTWKFNGEAMQFKVYRKKGEANLTLYRTLDGKSRGFTDNNLSINSEYQYGVQAVLQNGLYSKIVFENVNY